MLLCCCCTLARRLSWFVSMKRQGAETCPAAEPHSTEYMYCNLCEVLHRYCCVSWRQEYLVSISALLQCSGSSSFSDKCPLRTKRIKMRSGSRSSIGSESPNGVEGSASTRQCIRSLCQDQGYLAKQRCVFVVGLCPLAVKSW